MLLNRAARPTPGLGLAEEAEIHDILRNFRTQDFLKMLGLPGAPVDRFGKCEWRNHAVGGLYTLK
jgi:hypothetical protein